MSKHSSPISLTEFLNPDQVSSWFDDFYGKFLPEWTNPNLVGEEPCLLREMQKAYMDMGDNCPAQRSRGGKSSDFLSVTHRAGREGVDLHATDLAFTAYGVGPMGSVMKTVLFQLKVEEVGGRVPTIPREQLLDLRQEPVADCSFVLSLRKGKLWVAPSAPLEQATRGQHSYCREPTERNGWKPLREWAVDFINCDVCVRRKIGDESGFEAELVRRMPDTQEARERASELLMDFDLLKLNPPRWKVDGRDIRWVTRNVGRKRA